MRRAFRPLRRMGGMISQIGMGKGSIAGIGVEPVIFKSTVLTPLSQSTANAIATNSSINCLSCDVISEDEDGT